MYIDREYRARGRKTPWDEKKQAVVTKTRITVGNEG